MAARLISLKYPFVYDISLAQNSTRVVYCPQKETRVNSLAFKVHPVQMSASL